MLSGIALNLLLYPAIANVGEETNGETENLICNKFKSAKLRRKHGNKGNSYTIVSRGDYSTNYGYTIEIKEVVIYSERAINDE